MLFIYLVLGEKRRQLPDVLGSMKMEEFEVSSVVRGCHIYKQTWTTFIPNSVLQVIVGNERKVIIGLYAQQKYWWF